MWEVVGAIIAVAALMRLFYLVMRSLVIRLETQKRGSQAKPSPGEREPAREELFQGEPGA